MPKLIHYSFKKNLKVIDPKYEGTGLTGEERFRCMNESLYYRPRSWYYTKYGHKEPGLGPYKYKISIPDFTIFNMENWKEIKGEIKYLEYYWGISMITAIEYIAWKHGYRGVYNPYREVVCLFYPQRV